MIDACTNAGIISNQMYTPHFPIVQRGLELAHHEEQSRQQIKKERISHEATHQLLQQEIESHNRTKSEHDKAEQELQGTIIIVVC